MKAALVIMAAGLGSRYGGNKQVDGVGPNGEILMEYSIYDAIRAGFTKIVFVIKPGMEEMMRGLCGPAHRSGRLGGGGVLCGAGFHGPAGVLSPAGEAGKALWHRTCGAVRPALCK